MSSLPAAQPRRETNVAAAAATMQPPPAHTSQAVTQHQQLAQAFMGLPIAGMSGGIPMAVGMPPGMMGMLPHFSQVSSLHIRICLAVSANLCYYQSAVLQ